MQIRVLKKYLLPIFRDTKHIFTDKINQKRLNNHEDWTIIKSIKYCSIWQDKNMIKDIIEMRVNPKQDKLRPKSGAMSVDDYERRTRQICGITSFQMYLETKQIPYLWGNISLVYESLLYWTYKYDSKYNRPTDFNISPMYHKGFLTYIKDRYNIDWKSTNWIQLVDAAKQLSEWKFILLSLNQNIRTHEVKKNYCDFIWRHIVVLTWYKIKDHQIESIYIHNSSGFSQNNSQENFEIPYHIANQIFTRKMLILN